MAKEFYTKQEQTMLSMLSALDKQISKEDTDTKLDELARKLDDLNERAWEWYL